MAPASHAKARTRQLGPLEMVVLDQLWDLGTIDVSGMHSAVGVPRGLARNTTQSTLERLVRKSLAVRSRVGRKYEYRAVITREEWSAEAIREVFDFVPGADHALMLASFVDLAERTDANVLDALEDLVRQLRRSRSGGA